MRVHEPGFACFEEPSAGEGIAMGVHGHEDAHTADLFAEETIVTVTDRDIYVAGEQVYFALHHFLNGISHGGEGFYYLILQNAAGENVLSLTNFFQEGQTHGGFYLPDTLQTGIYQVFAYTDAMRQKGCSLHVRQLLIVNRFDEELSDTGIVFDDASESPMERFMPRQPPADDAVSEPVVNIRHDQTVTSRRGKLQLEVENLGGFTDVTVSVARIESFLPGSDKPKRVPVTEKSWPTGAEPPSREISKILLRGVLTDSHTQQGVGGKHIMLTRPDTMLNLLYARTEANGSFIFELPAYYFDKEIFLQPYENYHDSLVIEVENKWDVRPGTMAGNTQLHPTMREYIDLLRRSVTVTRAYPAGFGHEPLSELSLLNGTGPQVYSKASHEYVLDDFEPLDDMQDITRELIPFMRIRRQGEQYAIRVMNENHAYQFFDQAPMVFLDGVPVADFGHVADLGSLQLKRIELVSVPWRYGALEFEGVLSLFSRHTGSLVGERTQPLKRLTMPQVHTAQVLKTPDYGQEHTLARVPDYRHTLFWAPRLETNADQPVKLSFFAGDLPGTYAVRLQAVMPGGQVVEQITTFEVKL